MDKPPKIVIKGLQTFNEGDFYTAHECFEDAWREMESDTREFFRALLHLSGGYFRLTQDRPSAAKKFFRRALYWMHKFPSPYLGIKTDEIISHAEGLIAAIDNGQPSTVILEESALHILIHDQEPSA